MVVASLGFVHVVLCAVAGIVDGQSLLNTMLGGASHELSVRKHELIVGFLSLCTQRPMAIVSKGRVVAIVGWRNKPRRTLPAEDVR